MNTFTVSDEELAKLFGREVEARKNYTIEQSIEAYNLTSKMIESLDKILEELSDKILVKFGKALGKKSGSKEDEYMIPKELSIVNIKYVKYVLSSVSYAPDDKEPRIVVALDHGLYDKTYHPKLASILAGKFDEDDLLSLKDRERLFYEERRKNSEAKSEYEEYQRLKKKFEKS